MRRAHPPRLALAVALALSVPGSSVAESSVRGASWVARYDGPAATNGAFSPNDLAASPNGLVFAAGGGDDFVTIAYEAASGAKRWEQMYHGPVTGDDEAMAVVTSPDGSRVFVTGRSWGVGTRSDYGTVAYNAVTGTELWSARYDGPGSRSDEVKAISVSPDGSRVFVTGSSGIPYYSDYATVAYDAATGTQLWVARYDRGFADFASGLAMSADGMRVFVTGQSVGAFDNYDWATVAYDTTTGAELWIARHDEDDLDAAVGVAASPDSSRVFVTGHVGNPRDGYDGVTIAYDAEAGTIMWLSRPLGAPGDRAELAVTPDGARLFITDPKDETLALDAADGTQLWGTAGGNALALSPDGGRVFVTDDRSTRAYRAGGRELRMLWEAAGGGTANAVSPDGSRLFETGPLLAGDSRPAALTRARDTKGGEQLWRAGEGERRSEDLARAIATSPDGTRLFVTGRSDGALDAASDYATIAYDGGTGAPLWTARYHHPTSDQDLATAIAVSPDASRVFVTGQSGLDFATIAYDALSGAQRWEARYHVGWLGMPAAIAASPDGSRVFVTGRASEDPGSATPFDYATVAYDAVTGAELWAVRYDGPAYGYDGSNSYKSHDAPEALAVSLDGSRVFVYGVSFAFDDPVRAVSLNYVTIAYDAATGAEEWVARRRGAVDDTPISLIQAHALALSRDGSRVFVTGSTETLAYDAASGAELWVARYHTKRDASLAVSTDGSRLFVTGISGLDFAPDCVLVRCGAPRHAYVTTAYDTRLGAPLWVAQFDVEGYEPPCSGNRCAPWADTSAKGSGIAVDPAGSRVIVMGTVSKDYFVIAYDTLSGSERWSARHPTDATEDYVPHSARALTVSPNSAQVFVTGEGAFHGDTDFVTVAFCTTVVVSAGCS